MAKFMAIRHSSKFSVQKQLTLYYSLSATTLNPQVCTRLKQGEKVASCATSLSTCVRTHLPLASSNRGYIGGTVLLNVGVSDAHRQSGTRGGCKGKALQARRPAWPIIVRHAKGEQKLAVQISDRGLGTVAGPWHLPGSLAGGRP